jgi:hypothetical protein
MHTLGEDESIARLATGIKRFKLADEFNWIKIFQNVAEKGKSKWGEQSRDALAQIFENRRQYVKSAKAWEKAIAEYGKGDHEFRQKQLDQIVGNWGRLEPSQTQPAGTEAAIDFRFRNGDKVTFEAHAINVAKLLDDVKAYFRRSPAQLDWNEMNISNVGYRLVERGEKQYLGAKLAGWDLALKPRPEHVDDRVTVTTPLKNPGAYLLTAHMADGNTSRIIVWVSDTVIVKKPLENQSFYYVADAVTGKPIPEASLEFFGWETGAGQAEHQSVSRGDDCVHRNHRRRRPDSGWPGQAAAGPSVAHHRAQAKSRRRRGRSFRLPRLQQRLVQPHLRSRLQPDQGLHDHRPARLPPAADGAVQALGAARQV